MQDGPVLNSLEKVMAHKLVVLPVVKGVFFFVQVFNSKDLNPREASKS